MSHKIMYTAEETFSRVRGEVTREFAEVEADQQTDIDDKGGRKFVVNTIWPRAAADVITDITITRGECHTRATSFRGR